ncbi:MBL fold metallo-hydrolase [bacterium]|nr:MBL fold metallo-hydrolase [bacterium]
MDRRTFILSGMGVLMGAAAGGGAWFFKKPEFLQGFSEARRLRMEASKHFSGGKFQNLVPVEVMSEDSEGTLAAFMKFIFGSKDGRMPKQPVVSQKTPLDSLPADRDAIVWMGHSTFYIQADGYKIMIDPVFSDYASPVSFINKAFPGSNIYKAEEIPEIDLLAVSHDHWDHLDYPSIMGLKNKVKQIICPLGVGQYFEQWGFASDKIRECDWFDKAEISERLTVHVLPSQHFSGRSFTRNSTLWCGFAFITPNKKIYFSGDGGYGEHFKAIGKEFGGFDIALAENGQYDRSWHNIHLLPEETAQAAEDVQAKYVIPAHGGKFALSKHSWNAPYRDLAAASAGRNYRLLTPKIGQCVNLNDCREEDFSHWWEEMS